MILSMIAALDEKGGIGRGGRLPWHLSTDLKRFKALTMGHPVIMGRKTFRSIGSPLPGRTNIVVTRQKDYQAEGVVVAHSLEEALEIAELHGDTEAFIIGGGELYAQALPIANKLYLTYVHTDSRADIFFPELAGEWSVVLTEEFPAGEKDEFPTTLRIFQRT